MLDAFLPSRDENLFQPIDAENRKNLPNSPLFPNLTNQGFAACEDSLDNLVTHFTCDPLWEPAIDLGTSHLDPKMVDRLTGAALQTFAANPDFDDKMSLAFGEDWNRDIGDRLKQDWLSGNVSDMPEVQILPGDILTSANGAYSRETNTIYLSRQFLTENAQNPGAIADVLLEEYGHAIDATINTTDAAGDEGDIFSAVVRGETLSQGELLALKAEDDTAKVTLLGLTQPHYI
jgi:hypothetical protein